MSVLGGARARRALARGRRPCARRRRRARPLAGRVGVAMWVEGMRVGRHVHNAYIASDGCVVDPWSRSWIGAARRWPWPVPAARRSSFTAATMPPLGPCFQRALFLFRRNAGSDAGRWRQTMTRARGIRKRGCCVAVRVLREPGLRLKVGHPTKIPGSR